jgi:hypothetical protein
MCNSGTRDRWQPARSGAFLTPEELPRIRRKDAMLVASALGSKPSEAEARDRTIGQLHAKVDRPGRGEGSLAVRPEVEANLSVRAVELEEGIAGRFQDAFARLRRSRGASPGA